MSFKGMQSFMGINFNILGKRRHLGSVTHIKFCVGVVIKITLDSLIVLS